MMRHIPVVLGILLIVGLTAVEAKMSDRLVGSNFTAEKMAVLLKNVPKQIGDWHGEDLPLGDVERKTAGAIGYVSRSYRNVRTGETVSLWLIVGHSRDICRHTPDICYPSSGFKVRAENNSLHPMEFEGQPEANFWTNTFLKEDATGRQLIRVYWAWYMPRPDGSVRWEASKYPRWDYGNARALFKMYFTAAMRDAAETADRSSCIRFAREALPLVEAALTKVQQETTTGNATPAAVTTESEKAEK